MMASRVRLKDGRLLIDGVPSVMLCASLFYFRIPRAQWAERLAAVTRLGYHAIDVYLPWNFHEVAPGQFDFHGEKDVAHFLDLAADAGLLVLARPGPYICSEFDGGALPAWLGTIDGLRVRQNEPQYLAHVRRWCDAVLPILAARQSSAGGAVAILQIENELDFFPCDDPAGYLSALKAMLDEHGIDAPVIACAGQGDIERATGLVAGVAPAVNLYPDDCSVGIEERAAYYAHQVEAAGFPLLVTETNRLHRTLKRELAAGALLLGPYLQASGWNFDYASSLGNWGDPAGLMSSDYDFGGAIAPDGSERADAAQGRILARIIAALGRLLGAASAGEAPLAGPPGGHPYRTVASRALHGGGTLVGLTNLGAEIDVVTLTVADGDFVVAVDVGECRLIVVGLPLRSVGIEGTLVASDSELIEFRTVDDGARMTFHTDSRAVLLLDLPEGWRATSVTSDGSVSIDAVGRHRVELASGSVVFSAGGRELTLTATSTDEAGRVDVAGSMRADGIIRTGDVGPSADRGADGGDALVDHARRAAEPIDRIASAGQDIGRQPGPMERFGIYRGGARYSSTLPGGDALGILLGGASDILTISADGMSPETIVNSGTDLLLPFTGPRSAANGPLTIDAEIWGHANFHDERLPALRLGSLRGLEGAALITDAVLLDAGWMLSNRSAPSAIGSKPAPLIDWGGWSSPRAETLGYRRTIELPPGRNAAAVRITGTEGVHEVVVDGEPAGRITPLAPVLDISGRLREGRSLELELTTHRIFAERVGTVELLTGVTIDGWQIGGFGLAEVREDGRRALARATDVDLPVLLEPGEGRWLSIDLRAASEDAPGRDIVIRPRGRGVRLTFVLHGRIIGRVWTEPPRGVPFTGGRGDIALAPAPWLVDDSDVMVLAQTTGPAAGSVDGFVLSTSIDGARS